MIAVPLLLTYFVELWPLPCCGVDLLSGVTISLGFQTQSQSSKKVSIKLRFFGRSGLAVVVKIHCVCFFFFLYLSLYLSISLYFSFSLFLSLFLSFFIFLSLYLSIYLSIYLSLRFCHSAEERKLNLTSHMPPSHFLFGRLIFLFLVCLPCRCHFPFRVSARFGRS